MDKQTQFKFINYLPFAASFAFLLALILIWLTPEEKSLGSAIKLVFLHASLMWVAFGLVTIQGLLSLINLFSVKTKLSSSFISLTLNAGLILFLTTGLLGMVTAIITWGGVNWTEPRLFMLAQILLVGLATAWLKNMLSNNKLQNLICLIFTLIAWALVLKTELVMHPSNPIFTSASLTFKLIPVLAALLIATAVFSFIFYFLPRTDT